MVAKKGRKKKKNVDAETPITIGGGGGTVTKVPVPLRISYDPNLWDHSVAGILILRDFDVRRARITTSDVDIKLPLSGQIAIDLRCVKQ